MVDTASKPSWVPCVDPVAATDLSQAPADAEAATTPTPPAGLAAAQVPQTIREQILADTTPFRPPETTADTLPPIQLPAFVPADSVMRHMDALGYRYQEIIVTIRSLEARIFGGIDSPRRAIESFLLDDLRIEAESLRNTYRFPPLLPLDIRPTTTTLPNYLLHPTNPRHSCNATGKKRQTVLKSVFIRPHDNSLLCPVEAFKTYKF